MDHERSALDHPVSLFEHARHLHRLSPGGPLPDGGCPLPDHDDHLVALGRERRPALTALLREFIDDPELTAQDLHDRCAAMTITGLDVSEVVADLAPEPSTRLLTAARWLVRNGTDRRAVLTGLGLLRGRAAPDDVPLIKTVGLLSVLDRAAAEALASVPGVEYDLMWFAERSRGHVRAFVVERLTGSREEAVRSWVLSTPRELLSSDLARRIAEEYDIAAALDGPAADDELWERAGNLLLAMTSARNYHTEIGRYADAPSAYRRWVALAHGRAPSLERACLLAAVAQDLVTGPAAPVAGDLRSVLVGQIKAVLSRSAWTRMLEIRTRSGDPLEARRAAWVVQAMRHEVPAARFAVRVAVSDPKPVGFPGVQARIVIAGMPVAATLFDKGPAANPEDLLYNGGLRATSEPREIKLAEAYCTEMCCGALRVTIVRDGDEVVWRNWRTSTRGEAPPEVRFDAAAYDREVARAEADHAWEWPARTVARLIGERLRADPSLLSRWDCRLYWCTAWLKDLDVARLTFLHPARTESVTDPSIQFGMAIRVGREDDPEAVAAGIVESMRDTDPKSVAEMVNGDERIAGELGLAYRRPVDW